MVAMVKTAVQFRPTLRDVVFKFDGRRVPNARSVILVGSFNRWDTSVDRLTKQPDGWWTISVLLSPGEYPYLFIVDGVAWNDPEDDGRVPSEWGRELSVRLVR
jgi:hypothetical protein